MKLPQKRLSPHKPGIVLVLLGLLYGLGFTRASLCPLCIPYLILIAYLWVEYPATRRLRLYTWLSGLGLMLTTTSWMLRLNAGAWSLPNDFELQSFIAVIWLLSGLAWSSGFALLPVAYSVISRHITRIELRYICFAVAFMLGEWIRSVVFSIANYGEGASVGAYWSFGAFGLALSDTPLLAASRIVGLFGLSLLGMILLYGIFVIVRRTHTKTSMGMVLIPLSVALVGYTLPKNERALDFLTTIVHKPYSKGTIQTISSGLPENYTPSTTDKQLVVLPEYSGIYQDGLDDGDRKFVAKVSGASDAMFIDVSSSYDGGRYNELVTYGKTGELQDTRRKSLLIPGGEYLTYAMRALLFVSGNGAIIDTFNGSSLIAKSSESLQPIQFGDEKIGALACSSILAPDNYRQLTDSGSSLLTNSADLGVFRNAQSYHIQNLQYAKFISNANSRPYVQAAKQGVSIVTDLDGNTVEVLSATGQLQVPSHTLKTNDAKTPYTRLGEWVVWLAIVLVGLSLGRRRPSKRSTTRQRISR